MKGAAKSATFLVLAHLAVLALHGAAHMHLEIGTSAWQSVFIVAVIFVSPLVAVGLIWTRKQNAGFALLGISLAAALIFGVYYHFILPGKDNMFDVPSTGWGLAFRISALLLALVEGFGCIWCCWLWGMRRNRQLRT